MKPVQEKPRPKKEEGDEALIVLQLIAKRADELWARGGQNRGRDLEYWLQAEREVLDGYYSGTRSR